MNEIQDSDIENSYYEFDDYKFDYVKGYKKNKDESKEVEAVKEILVSNIERLMQHSKTMHEEVSYEKKDENRSKMLISDIETIMDIEDKLQQKKALKVKSGRKEVEKK